MRIALEAVNATRAPTLTLTDEVTPYTKSISFCYFEILQNNISINISGVQCGWRLHAGYLGAVLTLAGRTLRAAGACCGGTESELRAADAHLIILVDKVGRNFFAYDFSKNRISSWLCHLRFGCFVSHVYTCTRRDEPPVNAPQPASSQRLF